MGQRQPQNMQRQRSALTEDFQRHKPGLTSHRERESDNDLCRDLCEQRLPCGFGFHVFHHYTHLPSVPVSQRKSKLGRLAFSTHIAGFGMESCLPTPTTTEHDNTRHHIILLARCGQCHGCQWKCFRSLRSSEKLLRRCGALGRRFRAPTVAWQAPSCLPMASLCTILRLHRRIRSEASRKEEAGVLGRSPRPRRPRGSLLKGSVHYSAQRHRCNFEGSASLLISSIVEAW